MIDVRRQVGRVLVYRAIPDQLSFIGGPFARDETLIEFLFIRHGHRKVARDDRTHIIGEP